MTVLAPRARTISVRLSHEEFAAVERFCVASGARSISDLARNAICGLVNHANQENVMVSTISEYSAQVRELERKVEQLTAEIGLLKIEKKPRAIGMTEDG